ncbi:MAG: thioether cross-link-forming SCIFF peptide maturase [Oscillospiraceae bacterium]|jgi:uncharacterized protein|nr:thioether cross-link-forming SCIFF peptide maturase [Oscillospiraceae bacterium]
MIHAYSLFDTNIVLDIGSGSVHVVDPVAFAAIRQWDAREALPAQFPEISATEWAELFREIEQLIQADKLFAPEAAGDTVYAALAAQKRRERTGEIKALCLHVAHCCNLDCAYCFARAGQYRGEAALMPFAVGKRALDFLLDSAGDRKHLEVDFFGGEPLLNWQVVQALVAYARIRERERGKRFRFTLTTNGVLVDDDVIAFSNREMDNVVLSLDGNRQTHDYFRRFPGENGSGSYDLILPKLQAFARAREQAGKSYYMRGTFTHRNPSFLNDLLHMAELGFHALSMEPVVCGQNDPHALTDADLEHVMRDYEHLALEMQKRRGTSDEFTFYHYMLDLKHGPCLYKRATGCGAGTEYLAVTPTGELYPCHQFVGDTQYRMGNVWQGVTNETLREEFSAANLYTRAECRDCWARLYCAGGCAANACHAGAGINGVYPQGCALFRKRIECAIWLQAAASQS